jgi:transcription elongation factor S-II
MNVAFLSHQDINPEKWKELIYKKTIRDTMKFNTNIQSNTDMYKCPRCKSTRSTYYELQIRCADEPSSIFITCLDCGHNYRR